MVPPPFLPGALEREEAADFAAPEPGVEEPEEPSAAGLAVCDAAEFVPPESEAVVPWRGAAARGELTLVDAPLDGGAEVACPAAAGIEGRVSMGSAATDAGPAGPELL